MHVQPILGEPTLLLAFEGWNDACEAATAALTFINETLRGVPLADIDPDDYYDFTVLRPEVQYKAGESSPIVWPTNEFRYGVSEEGLELITGLGIEPHMRWRCFCDCISEVVKSVGVRRVVLLGSPSGMRARTLNSSAAAKTTTSPLRAVQYKRSPTHTGEP